MTEPNSRITLTLKGELFTGAPVPLCRLMERQGLHSPQGLSAFTDPEWESDDQSERFLEAIFADSD
jgi:hypothetical protein